MANILAYLAWNPDRVALTIPFINWPIAWYGILFVTGIFLSYFIFFRLLSNRLYEENVVKTLPEAHHLSNFLTDRLTWYIVIAILIGARLAHVLFYDFDYYSQHPGDIIKIWQGGLASHGAGISIPIALWLFYRNYRKTIAPLHFLGLFDMICLVVPLCGGFIRIGNFFNQEIIGKPTEMPWGVIFLSPLEGGVIVPRHPVQLYEAAAYFVLFGILSFLYLNKKVRKWEGLTTGLLFILLFTARFFLEFFKVAQNHQFENAIILMGQWLSIPFILVGVGILMVSRSRK